MNQYCISLSDGILKSSFVSKSGEFKTTKLSVDSALVNDTLVIDVPAFSQLLQDQLKQLGEGKAPVNILIDTQDVFFRFLALGKTHDSDDSYYINEFTSKNPDINLDNYYYSFQKLAPYVTQFVGVKKQVLDGLLQAVASIGYAVNLAVPWMGLLPKFIEKSDPCLFLIQENGSKNLAVSELNGIYFSSIFDEEKFSELPNLIKTLSVYNREVPIINLYTLNLENFDLVGQYEIMDLYNFILNPDIKNFELHHMFFTVLYRNNDLGFSQLNTLNFINPIAIERKKLPVVYISGVMGILVLMASVLGLGFYYNKQLNTSIPIADNTIKTDVLGDNAVVESTQSTGSTMPPVSTDNLKKGDLKVKIENASEVSGVAASASTLLKTAGYNVINIGNALEASDKSIIRFKTAKFDYSDLLIKDLAGKAGADDSVKIEKDLAPDLEYDVLIIVGKAQKLK